MERTTTQIKKQGELTITRVFDAPVERVWKAWTDPDSMKQWWGPKEWGAPVLRIDLKIGGRFVLAMRGPDGKDIWGTGVYREIIPFQKIVVTDSFADENGNIVPATYYGMSVDFPLEMLITVTFEKLGPNKTRMILRHSGIPAGPDREGADQGWSQSFDKLAEYLSKK